MAGEWDVVGTAPAQIQNPWAVQNIAPAPPAQTKANGAPKLQETSGAEDLGNVGIKTLLDLPHGVAHAGLDLIRRITGQDTDQPEPSWMQALHVAPNAKEQATIGSVASHPFTQALMDTVMPQVEPAAHAVQAADTALGNVSPTAQDVLHQTGQVASDVAQIAPAVGVAAKGAGAAGEALAASRAAAEATQPAAVTKFGFRTAENAPIARSVAGNSGREALILHNQGAGDAVLGAEAGVPHGTDLSYEALEAGRQAPNSVYARVASSLPEGPLSPNAQAAVQGAGGVGTRITKGTPDAANAIQALKDQLLEPGRSFTGEQIVNEMRGLRQEGGVNLASDDVSKQQLGKAQLDMARALEQHVADTLPPNAETSLEQLQQARVALAKNYAVQGALRGRNVDMQALARIQRADPDLLTGPMKDVADFANLHPEVSALPSAGVRYAPPGLGKDLGQINLLNPRSWIQPIAGSVARRSLTGGAPAAAQSAPVRGLGDEFAPIDRTPQPPPGLTASPPTAPPPAAAGRPGDIPLADVLSHGVEQSPPAGLSLAPEGPPAAPGGVPFRVNAEHAAGGLELSPEQWLDNFLKGNNADYAAVKSQGVPEGIVQRANNASGESPASLEAISRGTRPLAIVDQDGNEAPLLRDVTQIDQRAPKGKIIIDTSTGEIVDRGGMSQQNANGLRNRWATQGGKLGDQFVVKRSGS